MICCQNYADGERGEVEHLLDEVSRSLDRIRSQVVGQIQSQLDAVMSKGEGLVRRLETELGQLTDRRATLEVQAISQDHIGFLQVTTEPFISTNHVAVSVTSPPVTSSDLRGGHSSSAGGPRGRRGLLAPLPAGGGEERPVRGEGQDGRHPDGGGPLPRLR